MMVAIVEGPATKGTASGTMNGSPSVKSSLWTPKWAEPGKIIPTAIKNSNTPPEK